MMLSNLLCVAALAALTVAAPVNTSNSQQQQQQQQPPQQQQQQQGGNQDVTILQFALTLEHLENVFYKQALAKFSQNDFVKAGFHQDFLANLKFLAEDEQSHVESLTKAIAATGTKPVAACEYKFPITDVASFATLSSVLEGVGTSAYLGAAGLISDKNILNTAGSILVTESLHTSQQRGALGQIPAANALGTPVTANAIFTLASQFIASCPPDNPPLPFKAFPPLNMVSKCMSPSATSGTPSKRDVVPRQAENPVASFTALPPSPAELADLVALDATGFNSVQQVAVNGIKVVETVVVCAPPVAGQTVQLTSEAQVPQGSFVTFVSGLTTTSVNMNQSGSNIEATVPQGISGQTYAFITKRQVTGSITDDDIVAGPAIVEVGPPNAQLDNSVL